MPWATWLYFTLLIIFLGVLFASTGIRDPKHSEDIFATADYAVKLILGALLGSLTGSAAHSPSLHPMSRNQDTTP